MDAKLSIFSESSIILCVKSILQSHLMMLFTRFFFLGGREPNLQGVRSMEKWHNAASNRWTDFGHLLPTLWALSAPAVGALPNRPFTAAVGPAWSACCGQKRQSRTRRPVSPAAGWYLLTLTWYFSDTFRSPSKTLSVCLSGSSKRKKKIGWYFDTFFWKKTFFPCSSLLPVSLLRR